MKLTDSIPDCIFKVLNYTDYLRTACLDLLLIYRWWYLCQFRLRSIIWNTIATWVILYCITSWDIYILVVFPYIKFQIQGFSDFYVTEKTCYVWNSSVFRWRSVGYWYTDGFRSAILPSYFGKVVMGLSSAILLCFKTISYLSKSWSSLIWNFSSYEYYSMFNEKSRVNCLDVCLEIKFMFLI